MPFFLDNLPDLFLRILPRLVVLFVCLPVHEFGHAFVADKLGDPTPRREGRLTLNPFVGIDPLGAICLLLTGFGWSRGATVNPFNLRDRKGGMALVALAGPVMNLLLCFLFVGLAKLTALFATAVWAAYVYLIFLYIAQINLSLAVFFLIPFPPLDGAEILYFFLPPRATYWMREHTQVLSIAFLVFLILGGSSLLSLITTPIFNGILILFNL